MCLLLCLRRRALKATGFCLWCSSKSHSCPHFSKPAASRVSTSKICPLGQPTKAQHCYKPLAESKIQVPPDPQVPWTTARMCLSAELQTLCVDMTVCQKPWGWAGDTERPTAPKAAQPQKPVVFLVGAQKQPVPLTDHNPGSNPAPTVKEAELKLSGWLL